MTPNARDELVKADYNGNNTYQFKLNTKTVGEAKEKNKTILKSLETVKGNLRSKAIYSPSEMKWKKIEQNYRAEPSLVVTKWKCHLPILV